MGSFAQRHVETPNRFVERPLIAGLIRIARADRILDDVLAAHRAKSVLLRKRVRGGPIGQTGHHWCRTETSLSGEPQESRRTSRAPAQTIAGPATMLIGGSASPDILRGLAARILQVERTAVTSSSEMCPRETSLRRGKGLDEVGAEAGKRPARSDSFRKAWNLKTIPSREAQASIKRGGACEPCCRSAGGL